MNRDWLKQFYDQCGREVSLAYNVLNQTNNWGITLASAVITLALVDAVRTDRSSPTLVYPTIYHWLAVILAWTIMVRFFVRSALALTNMYRWNVLMSATGNLLSLPDGHPAAVVLQRNLARKMAAYLFRWRSPEGGLKIVWNNLKLMFLWFQLILLALIVWGIVALKKDALYWVGIGLLIVPTVLEVYWYVTYRAFRYERVQLEPEPEMAEVWMTESHGRAGTDVPRCTVFAFCRGGPYRHVGALLANHHVGWLPWSYDRAHLSPDIVHALESGGTLGGHAVVFASRDSATMEPATLLRRGRIDHFSYVRGTLKVTVELLDAVQGTAPVPSVGTLCFMLPE